MAEDLNDEQAEEIKVPVQDERAPVEQLAPAGNQSGVLPSDDSVIRKTNATPVYYEVARRLQEIEQIGLECDQHLKKVDKEMRAQRGDEYEDNLKALRNPLAGEILAAVAPPGYMYAPLKVFTGKRDHNDHIKTVTQAHDLGDAMICKIFASSLDDRARRWFDSLPNGLIASFEELVRIFIWRYCAQKRVVRSVDDLEHMTQ